MASIQERGPYQFRVQVRRNGTSVTKTFETRREAESWARITEGRVTGDEVVEKKTPTTLAQACEWMKGRLPETRNGKNLLGHYRFWQSSPFANWSLSAVHDWDLIELVEEIEANPQTIIHRLNALSKLYQTWSRAHRIAVDNPVKPGVRPGRPDGRNRRLADDEEKRLLDAADKTSRPWLRHCIIIALETAMRQSEMVGLAWDRVNLEQRYVDLPKTKNDRPRRVPLSERAVAAFRALRDCPKPVPVQTQFGIIQAFQDARVGFEDLRWHDLRHEAISRMFEMTDLRDMEIMAISGHLTPAMLLRYSHLRTHALADRLPGGKDNPRVGCPY